MYVTAQHVISAPRANGRHDEGINAFFYMHGPHAWDDPAPFMPETNPGVITDDRIEVTPGGNRVRSYLDIVAPDGTHTDTLASAVLAVPAFTSFPVTWDAGNVRCRFGVEYGLAEDWEREMRRLLARVVLLLRDQPKVA
jgi:hypothetical protein